MQSNANGAAQHAELTRAPHVPVERKVVGGITLYKPQLDKIGAYATANGMSRSAVIRRLIDEHL